MDDLAKFIGWMCIGTITYIFSGYVLVTLWLWFIIPALHAPMITIPEGIGFILITKFVSTRDVDFRKDSSTLEYSKLFLTQILFIAMTWGIGWVIHKFV